MKQIAIMERVSNASQYGARALDQPAPDPELEDGHVVAEHVSTTLMAIQSEVEDGEQVRGTAHRRGWGMRDYLSCMAERGIPCDCMGAARVVHGGADDPDAILKHTAHVRAAIGTAGTRKPAWR